MGAAFFQSNQFDSRIFTNRKQKQLQHTIFTPFLVVHCVKMILKFKVLWFLSMNNSLIDFVRQNIIPIVLVSVSQMATSHVSRSTCSTWVPSLGRRLQLYSWNETKQKKLKRKFQSNTNSNEKNWFVFDCCGKWLKMHQLLWKNRIN